MTRLEEIVAYKRQELAQAKRIKPLAQWERALKTRPPVRNFRKAITREGKVSLIAEVKRSSPSAGSIRPGADALTIAQTYEKAGAQAISVLTDSKFFSGDLADLTKVKEKVALPVLRKDFLLEEYQVVEAAASGADAILLIAAILERSLFKRLYRLAYDLEMECLVEVHTEGEVTDSLEVGAEIIGINNRDLKNFTVDLNVTKKLLPRIPREKTKVSESGIRTRADVELVTSQGANAVLIGEELMASNDILERIQELMAW